MPISNKKSAFLTSEEGIRAAQTLRNMAMDDAYHTEPSYSADIARYPDHVIPFVDKHMLYLRDHPATDPQQYLSNLKIMTRVKR